jgi:hypothetical protein
MEKELENIIDDEFDMDQIDELTKSSDVVKLKIKINIMF